MLLELHDITAGYGAAIILRDVSLHLSEGETVCLIGPNGAGKSTVLRLVAGQIRPVSGNVRFAGEDVTRKGLAAKGRMGLIFIPQGENIFPTLTVQENLEIAGLIALDHAGLQAALPAVFAQFPVLADKRHRSARDLSGGERQMLALSRALLLKPRLVLLDEPSLGLSPLVVDLIFEQIQQMNRNGVSFLLVEQNARKGLSVAHRGYVLELGRNRLEGRGRDLLCDPEVQKLYLGG